MSTVIVALADKIRGQIGKSFVPTGKRINDVTEHFVRNWAWALDERNPVYWDAGAARAAGLGEVRVPLTYVYMVARGPSYEMYGLPPGIVSLFGAQEWEFLRPLAVGDHVTAQAHIATVEEKTGKTMGPIVVVVTETSYRDRGGAPVAVQRQTGVLYESAEARRRSAPNDPLPTVLALNETVPPAVDDRPVLGRQRHADEVRVGDAFGPYTIGPARIDQFVRFVMVGHVPPPGDDPAAVHYDPWYAARSGLRDVIDMGAWRTALFVQIADAWAGPRARVRSIVNRYGGFIYRNDMVRFAGKVVAMRAADGGAHVDVEIWNDKGEGTAAVTTGTLGLYVPEREGNGR